MATPFERLLELGALIACLWVLSTAWGLDPDERGHGTHEQLGMAPCGFLATTGRPCPSCGMTTSFSHMAHSQPLAGISANPAGALLFMLVLIAPVWILHSWWRRLPALRFLAGPKGGWWVLGAALIVGLSWYYKDWSMMT